MFVNLRQIQICWREKARGRLDCGAHCLGLAVEPASSSPPQCRSVAFSPVGSGLPNITHLPPIRFHLHGKKVIRKKMKLDEKETSKKCFLLQWETFFSERWLFNHNGMLICMMSHIKGKFDNNTKAKKVFFFSYQFRFYIFELCNEREPMP